MVPKYGLEKLKLCYMDTDSLVYDIKTEDFYEDIANDVEARFDTSGYSKTDFRPLPIGLSKKGYRNHERRIRRQDNDRICGIETKALFL